MWTDIFLENREALLTALHGYRAGLDEMIAALEAADEERLAVAHRPRGAQRERMLAAGSLSAGRAVPHRGPDRRPARRAAQIMVALGDADINIEDLALHHMSAELGGALTVYVLGGAVCGRAAELLGALGYQVTTGRGVE